MSIFSNQCPSRHLSFNFGYLQKFSSVDKISLLNDGNKEKKKKDKWADMGTQIFLFELLRHNLAYVV